MRIAVFANGFDSGGSGIAHSLMACARALARRGHALLLGIPRDEEFDGAEPSEVAEGVEIVGLASLPVGADVGGRLVVPTGVAALHCRAWTPDLVHAHGPFGAGLEAMAAARAGVPAPVDAPQVPGDDEVARLEQAHETLRSTLDRVDRGG